jgi:hypothetical protein
MFMSINVQHFTLKNFRNQTTMLDPFLTVTKIWSDALFKQLCNPPPRCSDVHAYLVTVFDLVINRWLPKVPLWSFLDQKMHFIKDDLKITLQY